MSELFDEVDEEVRRDQLKKLWDQYSLYIIAGMILIIAAVGGWRGYQYLEAKKAAEAGAAFDKAVELSEANKHTEAEAAFADLVAKAPFGYRVLARLRMAAEIANRDPQAAAKMFDDGLIAETEQLRKKYGDEARPLTSLGYRQVMQFLRGEIDRKYALEAAQQAHRYYAKRQMTWFRREPDVHWFTGFGNDTGVQAEALAIVRKQE